MSYFANFFPHFADTLKGDTVDFSTINSQEEMKKACDRLFRFFSSLPNAVVVNGKKSN